MKKVATIALDEVKNSLRRGLEGTVVNHGGWCVFVDGRGKSRYVVDDENNSPVPYQKLHVLREVQRRPHTFPILFQ